MHTGIAGMLMWPSAGTAPAAFRVRGGEIEAHELYGWAAALTVTLKSQYPDEIRNIVFNFTGEENQIPIKNYFLTFIKVHP